MENNITLPVSSFITLPNGKKLKIVEKRGCGGCYFDNKKGMPSCKASFSDLIGHCSGMCRSDGKSVIYMLVKKTKTFKNQ